MDIKNKYFNGMYKNEVDNVDINGNYISDPIYLYQPIRRCGNKIYFYADVDNYSQLALIQLLNDIQTDIISRNAINIVNGECPESIEIHINSYGGVLSAGFALYDFIKNLQVNTIGIVEGVAMSAATLILLACDRREMGDNSTVLIHQLSGCSGGTYREIKDENYNVDLAMSKLRKIYIKETKIGITPEMDKKFKSLADEEKDKEFDEYYEEILDDRLVELNSLLNHDLELSKEECEKFGIIDKDNSDEILQKQMSLMSLTEEDQEKINAFVEKTIKSRQKQNEIEENESKPKTKKSTKSKTTKK